MRIEVNETLARMLATENLHIRYSPSTKTAHFEVKTRLLTLPLYSRLEQIVHLLLAGHEAFHALWTKIDRATASRLIDANPKNEKRAARYFNICEDVRIENLGKELYPGMRAVFRDGYKLMVKAGFFGDMTKIDQMSLIDRVNIFFKAGATVNVSFSEQETPLVQAINKARSFDEMIAACRAIYEYAKQQQQPEDEPDQDQDQDDQQQQQSKSKSKKNQKEREESETDDSDDSEESEDGEDSEDDESDSDQSEDSEESAGDESGDDEQDGDDESDAGDSDDADGDESDADADDADGESDDQQEADSDKKEAKSKSKPQDKKPEEGSTQDEFDKHLADHCDPQQSYIYTTLPKVKMDAAVVDYKIVMDDLTKACAKASSETTTRRTKYVPKKVWFDHIMRSLEPDVLYMVQQFMMMRRADQHARTRTASTGDLDMTKLWAHRITENIFATTEIVPDDKNHGLVLVVDWSGSMKGPLFDVLVQLLALMLFCRKAGIPFEVFVFITRPSDKGDSFIPAKDSVSVNGLTRLYNLFSSRMPQAHFYQMCLMIFSSFDNRDFNPPLAYLDPSKYGTPLGEAMLIASEFVPEFQKKNRLQFVHTIFLTDGDGNSSMTVCTNQLEDQKTRRTYSPEPNEQTVEILHLLPRIIRDRTRAKMIGFYVGLPTARMLQDSKTKYQAANDLLQKEGFMSVSGTHYDAFYVLNPAMSVPTVSTTGDPTEQIQMRRKSRVMLQQFIKMIA
jgi:hypothetical protein